MKKLLLYIICIVSAVCSYAQQAWTSADIPDSLKRDAYSVVRDYQLTVTAQSQKALTMHHHLVVTILNKKGENHAAWSCPTSKFEKLTSFSGKIYNDQGKVATKFKRSDVSSSQYSEHLASDVMHNYVTPPVMDYPYSVEYEWDVKCADGYVEYAYFSPIDHERQALQKAQFLLTVPSGTKIRYTALPRNIEADKLSAGGNEQYRWTLKPMRGIIEDGYEEDAMYFMPSVIAVPQDFKLGESAGSQASWESFGLWYSQLAEGRGMLSPSDIQKVHDLTDACANDNEKLAALYKYLGEKTRYVSIQLGIGGWQPMTAEEVGKTGFGDCKALTNYMQSLLREAGIQSYQTIISTEYANLLKGFPNMHQTNHVVLTVPQNDGKYIVVECTNPKLPLGYIPESLAGHEALQIKGEESALIRLQDYTPETSYENLSADVSLNADGTSTVGLKCDHYGARYGALRQMANISEKERVDVITHWIDKKDPKVTESAVIATPSQGGVWCDSPHIDVQAKLSVTYGDVYGEKIFIASNPFRKFSAPRFRKDRQRPIVVESSVAFNDTLRITIPEGYAFKTGEIADSQSTAFGRYAYSAKQEGNLLTVITNVCINKGRYDATEKDAFLAFRESISKMVQKKLILEKR